MSFDVNKFKNIKSPNDRYEKQLIRIEKTGKDTSYIKEAVSHSEENIDKNVGSFIIYGDPQSGKTEMMIALTAKLLDKGNKIIIILINDNIGLLEQNLRRFSKSELDPDPKNYKEIMDEVYKIKNCERVIFCKKNSSDLQKLINKLDDCEERVIIDDEADYASPNGKINKSEKTKINELITELKGDRGSYIGVTATPARLDLNNTLDNVNDKWVNFPSHTFYTGQDDFFPANLKDGKLKFQLEFIPDKNDTPVYIREALFRFFINVAYLNLYINEDDRYYSMLIHTSGQKKDHARDHNEVVAVMDILNKEDEFDKYVERIHELAEKKYGEDYADEITKYILTNRNRNAILVINCEKDKENLEKASNPKSLFTIAIGGNIVSRGVTFDNLLSMYFTRTVKGKMQQDTYIQRARMFGARSSYLQYFELTITKQLYKDWHKCFFFHRLALDSVKSGNPPVWPEDKRIKSVASNSIDKATVQMDSGEMSYGIFDLTADVEEIVNNMDIAPIEKLKMLRGCLGDSCVPYHLINAIEQLSPDGDNSVAIHSSSPIVEWKTADQENISRGQGFIGTTGDLEKVKFPHAIHHIKIFYNEKNKARIFYRFIGIDGIKFLKNLKKSQ